MKEKRAEQIASDNEINAYRCLRTSESKNQNRREKKNNERADEEFIVQSPITM